MSAPVGYTCPDINHVIGLVTEVYDSLNYTDDMCVEDYQNIIRDASSNLFELTDKAKTYHNPLEDLREKNASLRDWGDDLEGQLADMEKERDQLYEDNAGLQYRIDNEMWDLAEEVKSLKLQLHQANMERDRIQALMEAEHG